jgi:hypothetical protein
MTGDVFDDNVEELVDKLDGKKPKQIAELIMGLVLIAAVAPVDLFTEALAIVLAAVEQICLNRGENFTADLAGELYESKNEACLEMGVLFQKPFISKGGRVDIMFWGRFAQNTSIREFVRTNLGEWVEKEEIRYSRIVGSGYKNNYRDLMTYPPHGVGQQENRTETR